MPAEERVARNFTPGVVSNWRGPTRTRRCLGGRGARRAFEYDLVNSPSPGSQVSSVWRIPAVPRREKAHDYHPTQKPLRLVCRALLASTRY